jgi:hypothetical protein
VVETWINETLREAEYFSIPGILKRERPGDGNGAGGRQSKCMEYGIDRLTLNNTGISNENIDKLYRSFFVTSVGLFSQMKSLVDQQADQMKLLEVRPETSDGQKRHLTKASLLSALWRVYTVLLEYTYS